MSMPDRDAYGLPTTPSSIIRATVFGHENQLLALSMEALDENDQMAWTPLDSALVGETYVGWADIHDAVVEYDAGLRNGGAPVYPLSEADRDLLGLPDKYDLAEILEQVIREQRKRNDGLIDYLEAATKITGILRRPSVDEVARRLAELDGFETPLTVEHNIDLHDARARHLLGLPAA